MNNLPLHLLRTLLLFCLATPCLLPAQDAARKDSVFLFPQVQEPPNLNWKYGQEAMSERLYKNARRYFSVALQEAKSPAEWGEISLRLIEACLLDGDAKDALQKANELLSPERAALSQETKDQARLLAGLACVKEEDYPTALNFLAPLLDSPSLKTPPQQAQLLEALANAWNATGQWEKSRALLVQHREDFSPESPEREKLTWRLLDATLSQGVWQETRQLIQELEQADSDQHDRTLLQLLRIRCDLGEGKLEQAAQFYHDSGLDGRLPQKADRQWWQVLSALAQACQRESLREQAAKLYGDAATVAPDAASAREARRCQAEALCAIGKPQEARALLTTLHEELPQDATITLRLAEVRMALQERRSAAELFQSAAQDESLPQAQRHQAALKNGLCLAQEGLGAEASQAYQQAARLAQSPKEACDALLLAASQEEKSLQEPRAVELYLQVADSFSAELPEAADARLEAGRLLLEQKPLEAIPQFQRFLAERPDSPRVWEARLALSKAQPEPKTALAGLLEVARNCPDDALSTQAYFEAHERALAQGESGMEEALSILQEFLERHPQMSEEKLRLAKHQNILLGMALNRAEAEAWARDFLTQYPQAAEAPEIALRLGDHLSARQDYLDAATLYKAVGNYLQATSALKERAAYEEAFCLSQAKETLADALQKLRDLSATGKEPEILARAAFLEADLLTRQDAPEEALKLFARAREKSPRDSLLALAAAGRQAELLYALGRAPEAMQCLDPILRQHGGGDRALQARAKLLMARCHLQQGNESAAIQLYQQIRVEYETARRSAPQAAMAPQVYVAAVQELLAILERQGDDTAVRTIRQNYQKNPAMPPLP